MALSGGATVANAATPEAFPVDDPFGSKVVTIQAFSTNTSRIAVGYSGAVKAAADKSEQGVQLDPGDPPVQFRLHHPAALYIDVITAGDGYTYLIAPAE